MADGTVLYGPSEIERLTDIPMNTLRAWERRYGVPKPLRGPGGHRMYSETELQTLQWLRKQLSAGVSISHAIANLQAQQPTGPNLHPDALVAELVAAGMALDERRVDKALSDAFAFHTVERVCVHVITPALHEIGVAWEQGRCSVVAEHFTTSLVQAQLYAVLRMGPAPRHSPLFFVACPPNELHAVPALMLTVLLRRAGWRAMFFGADLPFEDVVQILPEMRPDLLMLSVSMTKNLTTLYDYLGGLRKNVKLPPVLLGGRAFVGHEHVPARLNAHFLGHDLLGALAHMDATVARHLGGAAARAGR